MLRLAPRALAALALLFVLVAPVMAAVAVSAQAGCAGSGTDEDLAVRVSEADLIVVGTVSAVADIAEDASAVDLRPESFLLGTPSQALIRFLAGRNAPCDGPRFVRAGDRVLVIASASGTLSWPPPENVYLLEGGSARTLGRGATDVTAETELIARIRAQTGQFSIPASSSDDGASINWLTTILPVGAALLGIAIAGFALMRVWHRIDPS